MQCTEAHSPVLQGYRDRFHSAIYTISVLIIFVEFISTDLKFSSHAEIASGKFASKKTNAGERSFNRMAGTEQLGHFQYRN